MLRPKGQIGHGDSFFYAIVHAINVLVVEAGEMQHGLAHGFAGNGAGVDGGAAHYFHPFDQGRLFAEFGGLDGSALAGGPGANDDEIERFHGGRRQSSWAQWARKRRAPARGATERVQAAKYTIAPIQVHEQLNAGGKRVVSRSCSGRNVSIGKIRFAQLAKADYSI